MDRVLSKHRVPQRDRIIATKHLRGAVFENDEQSDESREDVQSAMLIGTSFIRRVHPGTLFQVYHAITGSSIFVYIFSFTFLFYPKFKVATSTTEWAISKFMFIIGCFTIGFVLSNAVVLDFVLPGCFP